MKIRVSFRVCSIAVFCWVLVQFAIMPLSSAARADPKPQVDALAIEAIGIAATPIASFHRAGGSELAGGKLVWRGGLVLSSAHKNFGGWSGLVVEPDGKRFLAISDAGSWMSGDIVYKNKVPIEIANARIGPLLARDGAALARDRDRDAEGLALESGSLEHASILVSFERNSRIARYDFSMRAGVSPVKSYLALPEGAKALRHNSGLEAMSILKTGALKGSLIAFSERMKDGAKNHIGWIWKEGAVRQVLLADQGGYDISDIAALDDGGAVVLERRFRWTEGLYIRLRRISEAELNSRAAITGETLLEADLGDEIDNMEGIAVSRGAEGETVLTLISDDNFNHVLQRTVLLQFATSPSGAGLEPRPINARP